MDTNTFGKLIQRLRKERCLTQEDLTEGFYDRSTITYIETGRLQAINIPFLFHIATKLGVPVNYLLREGFSDLIDDSILFVEVVKVIQSGNRIKLRHLQKELVKRDRASSKNVMFLLEAYEAMWDEDYLSAYKKMYSLQSKDEDIYLPFDVLCANGLLELLIQCPQLLHMEIDIGKHALKLERGVAHCVECYFDFASSVYFNLATFYRKFSFQREYFDLVNNAPRVLKKTIRGANKKR